GPWTINAERAISGSATINSWGEEMHIDKFLARLTLPLLMGTTSAAALAQDAGIADQPPAAGPEKTAGSIESQGEIVVTARRVRRQNIRHNSRRRLAECGPRLGVDVKRRACGVASADARWSVA